MNAKTIGMTLVGSALGGALCVASYEGLQGCAAPAVQVDPHPAISSAATTTGNVAGDVGSRADAIDRNVAGVERHVLPQQAGIMGPLLQDTRTQTAGLRVDRGKLETVQQQLHEADVQVGTLNTKVADQTKEIAKLNDAAKAGLQRVMGLLIVLSVLGVGTSAALLYLGNLTVAVPLAIGCAGSLVTALIVSQYAMWLALGGAVCLAGGIAYLVCRYVIAHKAVEQITQTVETTKQLSSPTVRAMVFGPGAAPGYADTYHSPATKKLVSQIRKSGKLKLSPPADLVATAQAAGVAAAQQVVSKAGLSA